MGWRPCWRQAAVARGVEEPDRRAWNCGARTRIRSGTLAPVRTSRRAEGARDSRASRANGADELSLAVGHLRLRLLWVRSWAVREDERDAGNPARRLGVRGANRRKCLVAPAVPVRTSGVGMEMRDLQGVATDAEQESIRRACAPVKAIRARLALLAERKASSVRRAQGQSCTTGAHDRLHRARDRVTRARHGGHGARYHDNGARVRTTKVPLHVTRGRRAGASDDLSSTREAQSRANAHSARANALF